MYNDKKLPFIDDPKAPVEKKQIKGCRACLQRSIKRGICDAFL
jgi:hypothetical protein